MESGIRTSRIPQILLQSNSAMRSRDAAETRLAASADPLDVSDHGVLQFA